MAKVTTNKPELRGLVGHYFHTVCAGKLQGQGKIIAQINDDFYLCKVYSWLSGEETFRKVVKIVDIKTWLLYPDAEAMKFSFEHGAASNFRTDKKEAK